MNDLAISKLSYTVEQAMAATGLSRNRLYQAIANGSLNTIKIGRRRMIRSQALDDFLSKLERAGSGGRKVA